MNTPLKGNVMNMSGFFFTVITNKGRAFTTIGIKATFLLHITLTLGGGKIPKLHQIPESQLFQLGHSNKHSCRVEPGNSRGLDSTTVVSSQIPGISDSQCILVSGKSVPRTQYMCVRCLVAV